MVDARFSIISENMRGLRIFEKFVEMSELPLSHMRKLKISGDAITP
jgi:hypothetical protein